MESRPTWSYIFLGTALRFLQDCKDGYPVHGQDYIIGNIETLLRAFEKLGMKVTAEASIDLKLLLEKLKKTPKDYRLNVAEAEEVSTILNKLRYVLHAEAKTIPLYMLSDKRIGLEKLLNKPESLLRDGIFESLPIIAQQDIKLSARCIALELPTASAFHILRATEAVLRHFYALNVKKNKAPQLTWGSIVADMKKRRHLSKQTDLLDHLDHLRKNFRNPTQHPEKLYDMDEAQALFNLCLDAISRMY